MSLFGITKVITEGRVVFDEGCIRAIVGPNKMMMTEKVGKDFILKPILKRRWRVMRKQV
jgi:hypothetical protein